MKNVKGKKILTIEGNKVNLGKNGYINVYSAEERCWYNKDPNLAHSESLKYWYAFFKKLEHLYDIIIVKEGEDNIEEVIAHYGDINNEVAKQYHLKRKKLQVKGTDGKV